MCVNVFPKIYPTLIWSGLAGESQHKKKLGYSDNPGIAALN